MMVLTFLALYGSDIALASCTAECDSGVGWVSFFTMLIFLAEIVVNSYCLPKYLCSSMFWLDFLARLSLARTPARTHTTIVVVFRVLCG